MMSKQTHNDQTLTRYLLGALPGAEAERLDGLSFTDDEFAEALKAAERDLVDAYVQGELTGATLERFRSHYLASPLRREKVEFARAFQLAAEKNAGAQASGLGTETRDKSAAKRKGPWWFFSSGFLNAPRPALQWGAAFAAMALLVAGGWLIFENARLHEQVAQTQSRREELGRRERELQQELGGQRAAGAGIEQELARTRAERKRLAEELEQREAQAQQRESRRPSSAAGGVSVAFFVLAPQLRGSGQLAALTIAPATTDVALHIELEPDDHPAYRVALLDQIGGKTLWRSRQLKALSAGGDKTLDIRFRARLLQTGTYMLRVTGVAVDGAAEIVGEYPFRVVQ